MTMRATYRMLQYSGEMQRTKIAVYRDQKTEFLFKDASIAIDLMYHIKICP